MTIDEFVSQIRRKKPPASEAQIQAFEREIGTRLPSDYRAFLSACNGGYVGGDLWFSEPMSNGEPADAGVHHIGGFREESYFSLREARDCYDGRIPKNLLWIMDDPFGNAICLGVAGEVVGSVFFWNHELEPDSVGWDGELETARNIQHLTQSFTGFVAGLRHSSELSDE